MNKSNILAMTFLLLLNCKENSSKSSHKIDTSANDLKLDNITQAFIREMKIRHHDSIYIVKSITPFKQEKQLDTTGCLNFYQGRDLIGNIVDVVTVVKEIEGGRKILRSGNLSLRVCFNDVLVKVNDTLIVSAEVFDIFPYEKAFGFPSRLYKMALP